MNRVPLLFLALACASAQQRFPFTTKQLSEVLAELRLSSPGSDWAVRGREAAVATLRLDKRPPHHVIVFSGPAEHTYTVSLGSLPAGRHELTIERDPMHSASESRLQIGDVQFREIPPDHVDYLPHANMPVLFIRKNTIGRFSDIPLLSYCERLKENGQRVLQYTVLFSNEDGGTSTRALMARWGRTTDIEYIYRAYLDDHGRVQRSTVQGPGHKEVDYAGRRDARHALLMPVTDNNMLGEASDTPLRFQLAPRIVALDDHSREQVMDDAPVTYLVAAKELEREGKLRRFGVQAGENVSDVRNYAHFEYNASHANSALAVAIHLKNGRAYSSDLGRLDLAIGRDGWVRTTVELPPNTTLEAVSAIELRCIVVQPSKNQPFAHSGRCRIERVSKAFFLDSQYVPGPNFWELQNSVTLDSGQSLVFRR